MPVYFFFWGYLDSFPFFHFPFGELMFISTGYLQSIICLISHFIFSAYHFALNSWVCIQIYLQTISWIFSFIWQILHFLWVLYCSDCSFSTSLLYGYNTFFNIWRYNVFLNGFLRVKLQLFILFFSPADLFIFILIFV